MRGFKSVDFGNCTRKYYAHSVGHIVAEERISDYLILYKTCAFNMNIICKRFIAYLCFLFLSWQCDTPP